MSNKYYGDIEYKMPSALAKSILKNRKGEDTKKSAQAYLCKYVNEECGIKGNCVRVLTDL
jgi:hypothetical protein